MIEYLKNVLASKGDILHVHTRMNGASKFRSMNLIAADQVGAAFVLESNETVVVPWHSIASVSLGDLSK